MAKKFQQFVGIVQADPAVDTVVGSTGAGGRGGSTNSGRLFVSLKPRGKRKESAQQVIARLRPKLAAVPGATVFLAPAQEIRVGGRMSNALYQYTLQADNLADLRTWTPRLLEALKAEPILTDLNTDQQDKGLQT